MLSDEKIEELWRTINQGKFMATGFNTFARAIEAAVLAELEQTTHDPNTCTLPECSWCYVS